MRLVSGAAQRPCSARESGRLPTKGGKREAHSPNQGLSLDPLGGGEGGPAPGGHKGCWREERLLTGTPPIDHFENTIGECLLGDSHGLCSKLSEPGSPSRANLSPLIKAIKSVSAAQYLIPGALRRAAGFFIGGVDHVLGS